MTEFNLKVNVRRVFMDHGQEDDVEMIVSSIEMDTEGLWIYVKEKE